MTAAEKIFERFIFFVFTAYKIIFIASKIQIAFTTVFEVDDVNPIMIRETDEYIDKLLIGFNFLNLYVSYMYVL